MKKCAFLSMDNLDDFECYDELLFDPLNERGWSVEEVSWRDHKINWDQYEVVVIRSPWDYQEDPEAFVQTLRTIDQSTARLENSLELVEWNLNKTYLRDLQDNSIEIVPTLWKKTFQEEEFSSFFDLFETDEIIIKPTVSANADDTFWINRKERQNHISTLQNTFSDRPFLVQPFMNNIINEGEFSVFFFGDTYSHTILKTPKQSDFRVQEEHGGSLSSIDNPDHNLLQSARNLLTALGTTPLYSRMDYVRTAQNTFALMELELIEPSLYFNMDPESPERFADVFDNRMSRKISA